MGDEEDGRVRGGRKNASGRRIYGRKKLRDVCIPDVACEIRQRFPSVSEPGSVLWPGPEDPTCLSPRPAFHLDLPLTSTCSSGVQLVICLVLSLLHLEYLHLVADHRRLCSDLLASLIGVRLQTSSVCTLSYVNYQKSSLIRIMTFLIYPLSFFIWTLTSPVTFYALTFFFGWWSLSLPRTYLPIFRPFHMHPDLHPSVSLPRLHHDLIYSYLLEHPHSFCLVSIPPLIFFMIGVTFIVYTHTFFVSVLTFSVLTLTLYMSALTFSMSQPDLFYKYHDVFICKLTFFFYTMTFFICTLSFYTPDLRYLGFLTINFCSLMLFLL